MGKPGATGLQRIIDATGYSAQGLAHAWKHESAFRQELALAIVLLPIGFWIGRSAVERAALIACLLLVLIVELLNSAIEAAVDRIGDEHHSLSGRAKDLGSAAVFLSLVMTACVWCAVIWDRFLA